MQISKLEVAKKAIQEFTKDGISKYSKRKIGQILQKRHPDLFKTSEDAPSV